MCDFIAVPGLTWFVCVCVCVCVNVWDFWFWWAVGESLYGVMGVLHLVDVHLGEACFLFVWGGGRGRVCVCFVGWFCAMVRGNVGKFR